MNFYFRNGSSLFDLAERDIFLSLVGCMPVVTDDTKELIGMVTRTDLLRQHRYYNSLHYHNKGFSDSIAGELC